MKKRRKYTTDFKSKVALEALREQQPVHEIAKRYQIHPTQVTEWKKPSSRFSFEGARKSSEAAAAPSGRLRERSSYETMTELYHGLSGWRCKKFCVKSFLADAFYLY